MDCSITTGHFMRSIVAISTLLVGVFLLLAGNGLVGTLLGVRGDIEGFSSTIIGSISAAYYGGFVVGTFLVPHLIRAAGHVRTFTALASLCSITVLLHGLWPIAVLWILARSLAGVCMVGIYIVIESWLNKQTSNEQRGHIFSTYMTTTLVGLGAGQMLLLAGDISSLKLFALASVLMSAGLIPVALTRVREPEVVEAHRLSLKTLYDTSPLGVVGAFFAGIGTGAFWGLAPVMAAGIGLDPKGISAFMSATILGGIIMLWPIGRLSDRFDRRTMLAWVSLAAATSAFFALWLIEVHPHLILIGGLLYGASGFSMFSLSASHTNDHVDPEYMLETASSMQMLYGSGAILGPLTAGILMQFIGPASLLSFMGVAALLPALFARWRMWQRGPVPMEEQGDWVPQFMTSPAALEMHPDQEDNDPDVENSYGDEQSEAEAALADHPHR